MLTDVPSTLEVVGLAGFSWRYDEHPTYGKKDIAARRATALENAASTARSEYPSFFDRNIGSGYSVDVIRRGLHRDSMFDGVDVPGPFRVDGSFIYHQFRSIGIDEEIQSSVAHSSGKLWVAQDEDPTEYKDAFEAALSNLKTDHPDHWEEYWGIRR